MCAGCAGMFVDAHVHAHEYGNEILSSYCGSEDLRLIAVSDDYNSSLKTIKLCRACPNMIPSIGIHPWEVGSAEGVNEAMKLLNELGDKVPMLGEVGLDKKFVPNTFNKQLEVFKVFLNYASENGKGLNIHAAGAWNEVLRELERSDVKVAIIHWYTGPQELLKRIVNLGYFIGVNAAIRIQKKMREIARVAPLEVILTESDGPYNYRGMKLGPNLIPGTVRLIAELKGLSTEEVEEAITSNFNRLLKLLK